MSAFNPLHSDCVLEFLVREALPAKCANNEKAQEYFKPVLGDPEGTIEKCKGFLKPSISQLHAKKQLRSPQHFEELVTSPEDLAPVPGVYVLCLFLEDEEFFYVGQSTNTRRRVGSHFNASYRAKNPSLLYYMWERATDVKVILAVEDDQQVQALAHGGPALDVLEHWVALLFLALQLPDIQSSVSEEAMRLLLVEGGLSSGLNIREPLAQAFKPNEWPVRGISALKQSPVAEFRDYHESRKMRKEHITVQHERRKLLLEGQVYTRAVWLRNGKECQKFGMFYVIRIMNILIRIETATYHRWKPNTMRVHLDLTPEGQTHPNSIIRGKMTPIKYQDPARRLGIKISGVLNGTCWESLEEQDSAAYQHPDTMTSFFWACQDGDSNTWVPRWNKIVDWLERKDERVIRPRRCYLRSTGKLRDQYYGWRKNDLFTLHPLDTDNWKELHTSEEYADFNNDKKRKKKSTIPLPTSDQLADYKRHWFSENAPPTESEAAKEELATVQMADTDTMTDEEAGGSKTAEEEAPDATESGAFNTEGEEPDAWDWS